MIEVKIPATSANLGPGFDTLGLALNLYNTFYFEEISTGLEISGCDPSLRNEDNLVYLSMKKTFEQIGYHPKGIKVIMDSNIPISRGLGSSASCILGGVIGANELAGNPLTREEVFKIATDIEGHPDNIAPALFGGLVVSIMDGQDIYYSKVKIAKGLKFVALIPDFTLSTSQAREVLPSSIDYRDAVYNVGNVSLLLSALINGDFSLLKVALRDKLHEPYRGNLIPGYKDIVSKCYQLGCLGAYLSGAGPTIMVIINENDNMFSQKISQFLKYIEFNWDVKELSISD